MEFGIRDGNIVSKKIVTKNFLQEKYPLDLTLYLEAPEECVSVDEMRDMALERVKLFRAFEVASAKVTKGISFKEIAIDEMTKQNLKYFMPLVKGYADAEDRRRDYLSHYILRICYCRSEEYKKWFIAREMEFFKLKFFNIERKEDISLFMKKNGLNYTPIMEEEKMSLSSELINSTFRFVNFDSLNFYKVHFTEVLDLTRRRRVFVKGGHAYVPQTELYSVLCSVFKKNLIEELDEFAKNLMLYESDQRVSAIVRGLHTCYTGRDYGLNLDKNGVFKDDIDSLSNISFPLCMKAMHETFKNTHHLRHAARLQFGLFLKGIGVSMEESLKFWKEGFTKKPDINADVFEKRYAYSIRHNYGSEGKRVNYSPHNCLKIISTNVGPGENHGCPFKHYDTNSLKKMLLSCKVSPADVSSITDYATRGHYQLACTKYFEVTHKVSSANGINHPNQYFEDSQNLLKDTQSKDKKNPEASDKQYQLEPKWDEDIDMTNFSNIIDDADKVKNSQ
ncbi:hypothetical protein RUM43_000756 [Polyplax serrata]|uniref:DNA primase large subunit n=1 Tax=Polyplax serrata TaxID=468196 RepID=A0AAN8SDT7_POLSC